MGHDLVVTPGPTVARCKCSSEAKITGHQLSLSADLRASEVKQGLYEGRRVIKVPVVMARSDVVMNDAWIPQEELIPETWNGVPVTWGHPTDGQQFVSAQSPEVHSDWRIGRIFNTGVEGTSLKGEAWIEVDRAMEVAPGFIETLLSVKGDLPIDVSTGYFSKDEQASGQVEGREYTMINRELKPNHLAILFDEEGACSWADGCGVRSNLKRKPMTTKTPFVKLNRKLRTAADVLKAAIKGGSVKKSDLMLDLFVNERGQDDDRRQIIADLISQNDSPYTPDDEQSLLMMSDSTLRRMREDYLTKAEEVEEEDKEESTEDEGEEDKKDEEETANAEDEESKDEGSEEEDKKAMKDNKAALPKNLGELTGVITKVVGAALKNHKPTKPVTVNTKDLAKEVAALVFTPELKQALSFSANQVKQRRDALIDKIVANSAMDKSAVEKMTDETLELVANGLLPAPSYAGRVIANAEVDEDEDDPAIAAMSAHVNLRKELRVHKGGKSKAA